MAGGDAGAAKRESFWEASLLNEPGGGEFDVARGGGVVGGLCAELRGEGVEMAGGDDGVAEETAGAAAVGVAGDQEHAL